MFPSPLTCLAWSCLPCCFSSSSCLPCICASSRSVGYCAVDPYGSPLYSCSLSLSRLSPGRVRLKAPWISNCWPGLSAFTSFACVPGSCLMYALVKSRATHIYASFLVSKFVTLPRRGQTEQYTSSTKSQKFRAFNMARKGFVLFSFWSFRPWYSRDGYAQAMSSAKRII